ncbi:MAG TPA: RNA polymerase sigma factor, partial [Streptosporangiaceae bacterium]|nr:RNA polymerase sigma factor [Streptosporangiaceae bacterium]
TRFGGTLPAMEPDAELLRQLRAGDEQAFVALVERYNGSMLRLAASFVPSRAVAEEVVQDTWLAVLRGLDGFEGRSSLKTWLFRILVNRARTTGSKEQRSVPVADPEPAVDPSRFDGAGGWADPPEHWIEAAEGRIEAGKLAHRVRAWIDDLPARQREVVLLRDVEGMSSEEVCTVLSLTEGNQRVLLHRGRSRLRQLFEDEFREAR